MPTPPPDRTQQVLAFPEPASSDPEPAQAGTAAGPTAPVACYWDYCPNCSTRLVNQKCKYRCPRCHYFMSCSDFD